ncbi:MAG: 30S ribosomal protein S17 [Pseudomonadota bacterium]|jgi:small subunit ribosomal protein S17
MAETKKKAPKANKTTGGETSTATASSRGLRKTQEGIVVSSKMDKTIVVAVVRQVRHAAYGKFVRRTKKFYAHDEANQGAVGDRVRIVETRPLSKLKCWKLESILRKAE